MFTLTKLQQQMDQLFDFVLTFSFTTSFLYTLWGFQKDGDTPPSYPSPTIPPHDDCAGLFFLNLQDDPSFQQGRIVSKYSFQHFHVDVETQSVNGAFPIFTPVFVGYPTEKTYRNSVYVQTFVEFQGQSTVIGCPVISFLETDTNKNGKRFTFQFPDPFYITPYVGFEMCFRPPFGTPFNDQFVIRHCHFVWFICGSLFQGVCTNKTPYDSAFEHAFAQQMRSLIIPLFQNFGTARLHLKFKKTSVQPIMIEK